MSTPNLALETVPSNSLQPSVPINDSLQALDAIVRPGGIVQDKDIAATPTTVAGDAGKVWIVAAGATGAWATHVGELALSTGANLWRYFTPTEGWRVYVLDENTDYEYSGSAWVSKGGTAGRHSIPIMAGAIQPSVTGGCSAVTSISPGAGQPDIVTLDFDPSTEEYAQFSIPMPKSWNEGTVTAKFRWSHASTTTNFAVIWGIQAVAVSNDDTIAASFGTAQEVTDTGGTTNDLYISDETAAVTIAGTPAAEDTVFFRVYRKAAAGGDTLAIDARLHSVVLYITTDAENDA